MSRKKPPVMMIHGGFCGPWAFDRLAGRFESAGHKVSRPALRFHDGQTPPPALATTSLLDYAGDLEAELGDEPPILVGHSMGGLIAQMLAARRKVAALVLLAPSPPWGVPPSTLFEIAAAQALLLKVGFWAQILEPDAGYAARHSFNRMGPAEREEMAARLVPESGRATFELMHWGLDMGRASEVDARKVDCPVLLLVGSEDRINPPGTVERIAALYKDRATFETRPGMSHWLIGEPGWEEVAGRALNWLGGL
jgi:pimeloyl-ACP methyl ester carboxylesterase